MTPISAIGDRREAGFTLTELLVVVAIMGVLASVVLLAAPDPRRSLRDEGERFGARLMQAKDMAVLSGRTIEARITASGYGFDTLRGATRTPMPAPFGDVAWDTGTTADESRIAFDATGLATDAAISLSREGVQLRVSVDASGKVQVDAPMR